MPHSKPYPCSHWHLHLRIPSLNDTHDKNAAKMNSRKTSCWVRCGVSRSLQNSSHRQNSKVISFNGRRQEEVAQEIEWADNCTRWVDRQTSSLGNWLDQSALGWDGLKVGQMEDLGMGDNEFHLEVNGSSFRHSHLQLCSPLVTPQTNSHLLNVHSF